MLTKDFSGVYDYERTEAQSEVEYFLTEIVGDSEPDYCQKYVNRIAAHWRKVLTPEGFADFASEWNKLSPIYTITL